MSLAIWMSKLCSDVPGGAKSSKVRVRVVKTHFTGQRRAISVDLPTEIAKDGKHNWIGDRRKDSMHVICPQVGNPMQETTGIEKKVSGKNIWKNAQIGRFYEKIQSNKKSFNTIAGPLLKQVMLLIYISWMKLFPVCYTSTYVKSYRNRIP